jgi:branched-chain amino acid transport system substrate-binding protein
MPAIAKRFTIASVAAVAVLAASSHGALAQKKYDTGATDTEIKIGNIMPYSGPASAYGVIGKTEAAYFNKINAEGGINGRKINFISYDDGYSPPKAVEQARKLVEADEVLLIFNPLGTPSNSAIQKYMNAKKVPQIFVSSGAAKWNDPKNFPWTIGWQPSYQVEARIYAAYILKNFPGKTIGILYQNDDFGKDYVIDITVTVHLIDKACTCGHHAAWPASPVSSFPVTRIMSPSAATAAHAPSSAMPTMHCIATCSPRIATRPRSRCGPGA